MRKIHYSGSLLTLGTMALITSCATVSMPKQSEMILLTQPTHASCSIQSEANPNKTWHVVTPKRLVFKRKRDVLHIVCYKSGYHHEAVYVKTELSGPALGNLLIPGSALMGAVDNKTGAMYSYPNQIQINLKRK